MFKLGLVSVTFRHLSIEEVLDICQQADIKGIEWGGDVHVPPNSEHARNVGRLTEEAGLEVVSYGSYYRLGENNEYAFKDILETAVQLNASGIRVWAGNLGSEEADEGYRKMVAEDAKRISDLARQQGILIHLEYHGKTLTDTAESTVSLLQDVNRDNIYSYWQPAVSQPVETRLQNIESIKDWLSHVHVFHWYGITRLPLADGVHDWEQYLQALKSASNQRRYLMLEFIKNDDVSQFYEDAAALKQLIDNLLTGEEDSK